VNLNITNQSYELGYTVSEMSLQMLINIACNQLDYSVLPSSFGVAKSTMDYIKNQIQFQTFN